jgi:MFS family permease
MNTLLAFLNFVWRNLLVAAAYLAGLMLAGVIASILGERISAGSGNRPSFLLLFIASILLGVLLRPFASHLVLSRRQHLLLWGSLILFNVGSVTIEGAYFAPDLVSIPVPVLILLQLLGTLCGICDHSSIRIDRILRAMEACASKTRVVFLDLALRSQCH